jgi:hypothetical protein
MLLHSLLLLLSERHAFPEHAFCLQIKRPFEHPTPHLLDDTLHLHGGKNGIGP